MIKHDVSLRHLREQKTMTPSRLGSKDEVAKRPHIIEDMNRNENHDVEDYR